MVEFLRELITNVYLIKKIYALDNKTTVYCGHEYTNTNLNFLLSIFPANKNLLTEKKEIDQQLKKTNSSIPFNLGKEKGLNPFLSSQIQIIYMKLKNENNLSILNYFHI